MRPSSARQESRSAKSCLHMPELRRLFGYEKGSACFQDLRHSLVEIYTKLVLNADSAITGSGEVVEARNVFVKEMAGLE